MTDAALTLLWPDREKRQSGASVFRRRKWLLGITAVILIGVGWYVYKLIYVLNHIPEAYAAWDAGKVLVGFMKHNDGRWPASWDDLDDTWKRVEAGDDGDMAFGGDARATRMEQLREWVVIDWSFDPKRPDGRNPVTNSDGDAFDVIWGAAEPNEMVRDYLREASLRPATTRPATGPAGF